MKLSELIADLQELHRQYGDNSVVKLFIDDEENSTYYVDDLTYRSEVRSEDSAGRAEIFLCNVITD